MGVPLVDSRGDALKVYYRVTVTTMYYVTAVRHGREYTLRSGPVKMFSHVPS